MKIPVLSGELIGSIIGIEVIGSIDDVKAIVDIVDDKVLINDDTIAIEERI